LSIVVDKAKNKLKILRLVPFDGFDRLTVVSSSNHKLRILAQEENTHET
jgi:hypothetical protein